MEEANKYIEDRLFVHQEAITYRSLSRACLIHVNEAKNLLKKYYMDNIKTCHATYLISGKLLRENSGAGDESEDDGEKVDEMKMTLVNEEFLDETRSKYLTIYGEHIYSLFTRRLDLSKGMSDLRSANMQVARVDANLSPESAMKLGRIIGPNVLQKLAREGKNPMEYESKLRSTRDESGPLDFPLLRKMVGDKGGTEARVQSEKANESSLEDVGRKRGTGEISEDDDEVKEVNTRKFILKEPRRSKVPLIIKKSRKRAPTLLRSGMEGGSRSTRDESGPLDFPLLRKMVGDKGETEARVQSERANESSSEDVGRKRGTGERSEEDDEVEEVKTRKFILKEPRRSKVPLITKKSRKRAPKAKPVFGTQPERR